MFSLPPPEFEPGETFSLCISRVKNEGLRNRLKAAVSSIESAARDYKKRGQQATLYLIKAEDKVNGNVTKKEMGKVYTDRMAKVGSPGRDVYDKIMSLSQHDVCPMCGHRNVSTLDHVLPKAHYPIFSVMPLNLIPCCADCNTTKRDTILGAAETTFFHPYYDDMGDAEWLKAAVIEKKPCAVIFNVSAPEEWEPEKMARLENQFGKLKLNRLYSSQAAQEISAIRQRLESLFEDEGAEGVKDYLGRERDSRIANRPNTWQAATYAALCESKWFCAGGFKC
ncbi:MAG: HNH endonuclease [Candidatus Hydrogenedentes bacterium]|nr:HNH endonuclease [Candidatus Hydrogenedentota bacterium]